MNFIFVALGCALGAVGRYTISLIPVKTQKSIILIRIKIRLVKRILNILK